MTWGDRLDNTWTWAVTHRAPIGRVVALVGLGLRFLVHFEGHTELADNLRELSNFILGTGFSAWAAGSAASDNQKKREIATTMGNA